MEQATTVEIGSQLAEYIHAPLILVDAEREFARPKDSTRIRICLQIAVKVAHTLAARAQKMGGERTKDGKP